MAMNKDLTGQKFGHLSVVKRNGSKNNRAMWECKCDCGNQTIVDTHSLTSQNTKSYCRWATYKVQSNNTSRNHYITAFGETMTISQWADRFGVSDRTIAARINLLGWDAESAVSKPVRGGRHE